MPVEDHPRYAVWRTALDRYVQAEERYRTSIMTKRSGVEADRNDRDIALADYNKIVDEIQ